MKNRLSNFITSVAAEHIKKRGTGFYWTSAIIGLLSPILYFVVTIVQSTDEIKLGIPYNFLESFVENCLTPFAYFFFPLLIIITVSRITQLDHRNGGWQLMETQPSYKFSIYFSKFATIVIANMVSIMSFIISSLLLGYILTFIIKLPDNASSGIPLLYVINISSRLLVASLLITAIQYLISVLIPSFIWSIIIGFFGLLLTVFLEPFKLLPVWYPYKMLSKVAEKSQQSDLGYYFTYTETLAVLCSIIVLYIGFRWYQYKKFSLAFFKTGRAIALLAIVVIFGGLFYWVLTPNQMPDYNKTVIRGKIDSDEKLKTAYLVDVIIEDTIAIIPITNNTFDYTFKESPVTDYYHFIIDGKYEKLIFFGKNDNINIEGKIFNHVTELKIKGSRLAENQLIDINSDTEWSTLNYYIQENINLDNPELITKLLYEEWEEKSNLASTFRTADNYVPKTDYAVRSKKLVTASYLNLWEIYLIKRAALYPNQKIVEDPKIQEIRKQLPYDDESMLSNAQYFEYVKSQLIKNNTTDTDSDSKAIQAIAKLKSSSFKNKLLFWQMKKIIETADSDERELLIKDYSSQFTDANYLKKIVYINKVVESLGKGKTAPAFETISIDGKKVSLDDLKGKFIAIDVWATWCGPCKRQSPFFEKMALKYKKENIVFAAISTDENKGKWFIEAKGKSKSVLQLHFNDPDLFGKQYDVPTIPRFILIDPDGKFVNARMPYPESDTFEILLRKALGLPDK